MKTKFSRFFLSHLVIWGCLFGTASITAHAQNIFPSTGRAGIYTTSPVSSLQVKGGARIGTTANYINIDSATGKLTFGGTGVYQVAGNKYAFQYTGNPNYGLYFNSTAVQYEFRNGSAVPVFTVNANTGNSIFTGTLKVGTYTLPATDGTNGQVLKTNGSGVLTWGIDNNNTYDVITAAFNTGIGNQSLYNKFLYPNSTGINNTAAGIFSLYADTSGYNNTAIGAYSLNSNTNGYSNTATGHQSLFENISGNNNTAYGESPLYLNEYGSFNTAIGSSSLLQNITGNNNTATGANSLELNNGNGNTANGYEALYSNTTGYSNTALGENSLYKNTYGSNSVAIGESALYNNGTNAVQSFDGTYNTAIGSYSLYANTIGYNNAASGGQALYDNTSGYNNAAFGLQALYHNVNGFGNTALGVAADVGSGGLTNAAAIGYFATVSASNKMQLGSTTAVISTSNGYTIVSDGRFKEQIKDNDVPGLAFINKLRPVTYNFNYKKFDDFLRKNSSNDSIKTADKQYQNQLTEKAKKRELGFIAQDVDKAVHANNYTFTGVYAPQNDNDNYALDYSRFVVPLVKAVQELSKMNDNKDAKIDTLQQQLNDLRNLVLSIQQKQDACSPCSASISTQTQSSSIILTDGSSLQQNIPNPFTHNTLIGYSLPQTFTKAQIIITDKTGKTLKAVNVSGSGKGNLNVDAATLASGAYQYSLIVDGKLIASKQMVLAR